MNLKIIPVAAKVTITGRPNQWVVKMSVVLRDICKLTVSKSI